MRFWELLSIRISLWSKSFAKVNISPYKTQMYMGIGLDWSDPVRYGCEKFVGTSKNSKPKGFRILLVEERKKSAEILRRRRFCLSSPRTNPKSSFTPFFHLQALLLSNLSKSNNLSLLWVLFDSSILHYFTVNHL